MPSWIDSPFIDSTYSLMRWKLIVKCQSRIGDSVKPIQLLEQAKQLIEKGRDRSGGRK
jgi:hypothetical protein